MGRKFAELLTILLLYCLKTTNKEISNCKLNRDVVFKIVNINI